MAGNLLELSIGREVRSCRRKRGMTLMELARVAGLSLGMMSKIENGIISASLSTLQALSQALNVPLTSLLGRFEDCQREVLFVRSGTGTLKQQCDSCESHHHHLLGSIETGPDGVQLEPCLVTLTSDTDKVPLLQHPGMKFVYLLEGEMVYRHCVKLYRMCPGDSLLFNAEGLHGPSHLSSFPIRFLSVRSH